MARERGDEYRVSLGQSCSVATRLLSITTVDLPPRVKVYSVNGHHPWSGVVAMMHSITAYSKIVKIIF